MSKRTVEELQEAKRNLESDIMVLVEGFETEYDCRVTSVDAGDFVTFTPAAGGQPARTRSSKIRITVEV